MTTLREVARIISGTLIEGNLQDPVSVLDATTDSREAPAGGLFFARIGAENDGLDFLEGAISGKVAAVVTQNAEKARRIAGGRIGVIEVPEVTVAYGDLARWYLGTLRDHLTVFGITGSAGKTTTKDLLWAICDACAPAVSPVGSFNNEVGLPRTIFSARPQTRYLVLEMGASGPGHLQYLTGIAPVDVAVELMVGRAHLGGFGTIEDVACAKSELLDGITEAGRAVLNADDPLVAQMAAKTANPFWFGKHSSADLWASDIQVDDLGKAQFVANFEGEREHIHLGLVGVHHVTNALAALGAAIVGGIDFRRACRAIAGLEAKSPHRMAVKKVRGATIIDDAYNANPDSMMAALSALERMAPKRKVAVLGQMLELGPDSPQIHAGIGQAVLAAGVSIFVGVGADMKFATDAVSGHAETHWFETWQEASSLVENTIKPTDTALFKGSNGSGVWHLADLFTEGD
ncbi:MAG: UDP-N-acetylmuramoyl-tripeptide--D-alanyl-D-alanine ligase [Actinomycetaceae bacterium]|nr:UDP-N-acetylmuramoyl-tripeptide--D-alanyl-D-alanine ligase [Actinomycetaceae bacterium]